MPNGPVRKKTMTTNYANNSSDGMGTEIVTVPSHEVYRKPKAVL